MSAATDVSKGQCGGLRRCPMQSLDLCNKPRKQRVVVFGAKHDLGHGAAQRVRERMPKASRSTGKLDCTAQHSAGALIGDMPNLPFSG